MRFGIRFIEQVGSARELVRLSVMAEEAGFDFVWFPHDAFMKNTWVMTAAVAEHTSRVMLGSVGTNPFTTDPSEIATYLATLDELSEGRAVLGLGLHTTDMLAWAGIDGSRALERTRAATTLIRTLLRGEVAAVDGVEFRWSAQCYLRFRPLRPAVPIYVSAFGEEYLALSGEIGDGSLPMITPPESAPRMVAAVLAGARRAGRDASEIDVAGCAWLSLAEDPVAAHDKVRPMVAYFGPYLEPEALATVGVSAAEFNPIRELIRQRRYDEAAASVTEPMLRLAISGGPNDVIRRVEWLAEQGVTQVNLGGPLGPDPAEAIRLMGRQVIPYFRS